MPHIFLNKAFEWLDHPSGEGVLGNSVYCATRDVFQGRLDKFRLTLEKNKPEDAALFTAICGEIGNNSFDHNIGNWRGISGVYFDFDTKSFTTILADRGQGVRASLGKVMPELKSDKEAVEAAFTKRVSGRYPESRGNGLKFVRGIIEQNGWHLDFFSGLGIGRIENDKPILFFDSQYDAKGCVALISMQ